MQFRDCGQNDHGLFSLAVEETMQYFVDMKAVSSGDGSKERPFQKINEAAGIAKPREPDSLRTCCMITTDRME